MIVDSILSFSQLVFFNLPLRNVFLLEELLFVFNQSSFGCGVARQRFFAKPVCLFETACLLALILEPTTELLVSQFTSVQNKVAVLDHHVSETLIKVCNLGDLCNTQHFRKMVDFGANSIIIIC